MGVICALGATRDQVFARSAAGWSLGIVADATLVPGRTVSTAPVTEALPELPASVGPFASRNAALALAAYRQLAAETQAAIARWGAGRVGVVMGSSTSGIANGEAAMRAHALTGCLPAGYDYRAQEMGSVGLCLATLAGARGPVLTVSTACSSSAKAFAVARRWLDLGVCDAVLTGGADELCRLTLNGFASLESTSARPCNPMSRNRDGITIGEAAVCFLMTREEGGIQLLGVGESSDAHHQSAPDPTGQGAALAIRRALADASLAPADIAYVNLHGTATRLNDSMESLAVAEVLGTDLPCSSTKPLHGHTLGAAGALEAALCWLALDRPGSPLPPHRWDGQRDPALAPLRLVAAGDRFQPHGGWTCCLSNSFAFGGSNCSVILGREGNAA